MRTKHTINQLMQELTALDLATKHLHQQINAQMHTIITLKKALQAPLTMPEQQHFDGLTQENQTTINKSADLIASSLRSNLAPRTTFMTMTAPTPDKAATKVADALRHQKKHKVEIITPKQTRTKSTAPRTNVRWNAKEEATLRKLVKQGKSMNDIAAVLNRTAKACDLHWRSMKKAG